MTPDPTPRPLFSRPRSGAEAPASHKEEPSPSSLPIFSKIRPKILPKNFQEKIRLEIAPITLTDARMFVAKKHRHNKAPQGGLFAVSVKSAGEVVGVAIVGRPVARNLDDGKTCEVTRLCTDGTANGCSMLYGACARAAQNLGWERIITYTLAREFGASLRASGWERDAEIRGEASWSRPSRPRVQTNLFGEAERPAEDKIRWVRHLSKKISGATRREGTLT